MEEIKTKWVKVQDEPQLLNMHRIKLDNGREFELAIHPVVFGFRVVGQYANDRTSFELNWCCGDNKLVLHATQKLLMKIIEQGTPIKDIPFASDIKPWPKDKDFIERVAKLVKNPIFADIVAVMDGTRPEL